MNNFKKIGMTALAASLVSTSVFAGELTASGAASVTAEGWNGTDMNKERALSMADSVVLAGSTELDNGMTVSMSFELDSDNVGTSSYDDKSVTIASDTLGTFKFSGHGGSTAASAMDATAAGDIWDNFDGVGNGGTGVIVSAAEGGNNSIFYTLPSLVDGLAVTASYRPETNASTTEGGSATGYGVTYTGVEGLSVSYAVADEETGTASTSGDQTVMKASYAYGPVTVAYSNSEYDVGTAANEASEQEVSSYSVSYTVSDSLSVTYGTETITSGLAGSIDAEYEGLSAAYTAGGMTITAKRQEGDNISHVTSTNDNYDYWSLGLSFAF